MEFYVELSRVIQTVGTPVIVISCLRLLDSLFLQIFETNVSISREYHQPSSQHLWVDRIVIGMVIIINQLSTKI